MIKNLRILLIKIILIVLTFILQNSLSLISGDWFSTPNLLIVLTCIFGYIGGGKEGMLIGFISGFIVDVFAADILGMNALLYLYVGAISGIFHRLFYKDMVVLPLAIVCIGDFLYNFGYYIFRFLLRNKLNFPYYFNEVILPEMVFTIFMALLSYQIIYWIYSKWLMKEQRSTLNFD